MSPRLLVVGAGPAGVSAALWARSTGLEVELIEGGSTAGGQLHHVHFAPTNFAGSLPGEGEAIATRLAEQLAEAGVEVRYDTLAVSLAPDAPVVRTAGGERLSASAVLIATGVRRRRLEIPGEREFEGRGVSFSATHDRARFAGAPIVVVGGGDGAFENALLLAAVGCQVTLVMRGSSRARRQFRERVAAERGIELIERAQVTAVLGGDRVEAVRLESPRGAFELPAEGVVIKVGVTPNSEWCIPVLEHDAEGYLLVDDQFGTSHPGVWAAGDVTRPPIMGLAVAVGQGALAVAAMRAALEAE